MSRDGIRREVDRLAEAARNAGIGPDDALGIALAQVGTVALQLADTAERLQAVGAKAPPLEREVVAAVERSNAAIAHRIAASINRRTSVVFAALLFLTAVGSGLAGYFARGAIAAGPAAVCWNQAGSRVCVPAVWIGGEGS